MHSLLIAVALAANAGGAPSDALVPGTISVEQPEGAAARPIDGVFGEAVQHALLQTSFMPLPAPSHSRYVAAVTVSQHARGLVTSAVKPSAPSAAVANWGAGVNLSLPTKDEQLRGLVVTELTVTVSLRADRRTLWTGHAVTAQVDGTAAGAPAAVAARLTGALFARFPRPLEGTLSVP